MLENSHYVQVKQVRGHTYTQDVLVLYNKLF